MFCYVYTEYTQPKLAHGQLMIIISARCVFTLSGRVGNLSPEFFHNTQKVSVSVLCEPIGTDHQRIRQT
jgi:hypothetical protein